MFLHEGLSTPATSVGQQTHEGQDWGYYDTTGLGTARDLAIGTQLSLGNGSDIMQSAKSAVGTFVEVAKRTFGDLDIVIDEKHPPVDTEEKEDAIPLPPISESAIPTEILPVFSIAYNEMTNDTPFAKTFQQVMNAGGSLPTEELNGAPQNITGVLEVKEDKIEIPGVIEVFDARNAEIASAD